MNTRKYLAFFGAVWTGIMFFAGSPLFSAEVNVSEGDTYTVENLLSLSSEEKYGNAGLVSILAGGTLQISNSVTNIVPLAADVEGLDLGKIVNNGTIAAAQTIRIQRDSSLKGSIISTDGIIFDGPVQVDGKLRGSKIVFNAGGSDSDISVVDLTGDGILDTENLIVNGKVQILLDSSKIFETSNLDLGQPGASLNVDGDMTVLKNFRMSTESTLISKLDAEGNATGNIILKGEGPENNGTNNELAGTIAAGTLTVQNKTLISNTLNVYADLVFDTGSETHSKNGLIVFGKARVETGAILKLDGDPEGTSMIALGNSPYNGIFAGGLELAEGATLTMGNEGGALYLAFLDKSSIAAGAKVVSENMFLSGVNTSGTATVQSMINAGSITSTGKAFYSAIDLENVGDGTISVNSLYLLEKTLLDLSGNNAANGGLVFSGDSPGLYISIDSVLKANGEHQTLEFSGVTINNWNTTGGIQARALRLGNGAVLSGNGMVLADTVFMSGSKLLIGTSHTNFKDRNVTFETGSTIALTLDPEGYGTLLSTGAVHTQNGVYLEIADGSNFDGRQNYFCVAQGGAGSDYSLDLQLANSLFFKMLDVIHVEDTNSLWVEIAKVADMVDFAGSGNRLRFAQMIDEMLANEQGTESQNKVFNELMRIGSDIEYRNALGNVLGSIRSNSLLIAYSEHWKVPLERVGMERLSLDVDRRKHAATKTDPNDPDSGADPVYHGQISRLRQSNLWFNSYYNHTSLSSDHNAPGGNGNRGGIYLGNEWTPSSEALLGVMFGYGGTKYSQDDGDMTLDDFQFGLYGGVNMFQRNIQVRGYVGYGLQDYSFDRSFLLKENFYSTHGKTSGDSLTASLQFIRPMDLSETFLFKPTLGIDFEQVNQKGFSENGDLGVILSYKDADFTRTMLRIGASGERKFDRGEVWGRFFYGVKIAGDNAAVSRNQFVGGSSDVAIYSVDVGDSVFDLGFGGRYGMNPSKTVLLFLDYNGSFTKRSDSHTGSLGVIWKR